MTMDAEDDTELQQIFTHEELLAVTSGVLNELLFKDPYLSDLPKDVTLDEINNEIELLHGKSITINVVRGEEILPVIVPQSVCRVYELKRSIKRSINLKLERSKSEMHRKKKISWRYVWKAYNLECNGTLLDNDNTALSSYGVCHKSYVTFVKKRRKKHI